jgi:hypothetical protein
VQNTGSCAEYRFMCKIQVYVQNTEINAQNINSYEGQRAEYVGRRLD